MKNLLIIEDDPHIAELEKDYLELNGFQVDVEHNGMAGYKKALTGSYDLIVVDIMLPDKDGYQIIKGIREKLEVPLVVVSAKSEDIDKIRGLGWGADDYLTKPFSPAELVARINSHIKRYERLTSKKTANDTILQKDLEIYTSSHRVYCSGKEVHLTAKEYDLLLFLASNPNMVFTKEQLFDRIWGEDYYGEIATVAVHIQKIRKKIEKDPAQPQYIETLWGSGYRFNG